MKTGIRFILTGAFAIFVSAASTLAQMGDPQKVVQETQIGPNTEYNVINPTNLFPTFQFSVVAFVVNSAGGDPFTSNLNWTAEKVDATSWEQPMGGNPANQSWASYTRMVYTEAFPANPASLEGYVVDFGSGQAIAPGTSLDGFFFPGAPDPTDRFLLIADHGPVIIQGQRITDAGTVAVVPEPGGLGLCLLAFTIAVRRKLR